MRSLISTLVCLALFHSSLCVQRLLRKTPPPTGETRDIQFLNFGLLRALRLPAAAAARGLTSAATPLACFHRFQIVHGNTREDSVFICNTDFLILFQLPSFLREALRILTYFHVLFFAASSQALLYYFGLFRMFRLSCDFWGTILNFQKTD